MAVNLGQVTPGKIVTRLVLFIPEVGPTSGSTAGSSGSAIVRLHDLLAARADHDYCQRSSLTLTVDFILKHFPN